MKQGREAVEREIKARCAQGAFELAASLLLETYGRELFGFLLARVRDRDAAGEVFSQFCEDLWRGLPDFAWRCSARTWAYTVARHAMSRHARSAQRERRNQLPLSRPSQLSALEQQIRTQTPAIFRSGVKRRLAELREQLSADDQMLLLLRVNRQLDWIEIAHIMLDPPLGADEATLAREAARLRKRFQLAKQRLRELAMAEGLIENE
jgi:RNA polymerase sigma-70 factor, ECF subfamily